MIRKAQISFMSKGMVGPDRFVVEGGVVPSSGLSSILSSSSSKSNSSSSS